MAEQSLTEVLQSLTAEGELYVQEPDRAVRCFACGHRCLIKENRHGICYVRYNEGGRLRVPWGYVAALQCDPTEKKPFFHILPGSNTLTFGMLGCDYHCGYCQNWLTSQTLRDQAAGVPPQLCTPDQLAQIARRQGAKLVASSYNEPLITSEWARAIFEAARAEGLRCCYVSNGNATPEVIDYIKSYLVGYKIDLKTMNDRNYRKLGGVLENVLEGIRLVHAAGLWLEIVTLLVPGFNDDPGELRAAAEFLAGLSPDIPWHVTAFHQDYKMVDPDNTTARDLMRAAEIGAAAGLRYVYCGNLPGQVDRFENTYCPGCQELLIARFGYRILLDKLSGAGRCPRCRTAIPGIWV
jgi:pyruvate formate lyase activating enzyme